MQSWPVVNNNGDLDHQRASITLDRSSYTGYIPMRFYFERRLATHSLEYYDPFQTCQFISTEIEDGIDMTWGIKIWMDTFATDYNDDLFVNYCRVPISFNDGKVKQKGDIKCTDYAGVERTSIYQIHVKAEREACYDFSSYTAATTTSGHRDKTVDIQSDSIVTMRVDYYVKEPTACNSNIPTDNGRIVGLPCANYDSGTAH